MQIQIEFSTHLRENTKENEETLKINNHSFKGQNKRLFGLLMDGHRITFADAFIKHGISDIRRRAKDLTDKGGFQITKEFLPETRLKVWFMTKEQIELNKLKLIK